MGDDLSWRSKYSLEAALQKKPSSNAGSWSAVFHVKNLKDGSSGNFTVMVQPQWAPVGARRFRRLLEEKFYDGSRFFRVIRGFVAQWGISPDPARSAEWQYKAIADDIVRATNKRGRLSFAAAGLDSRTTQVFINLADNRPLDKSGSLGGFAPFAEVVDGMDVVDRFYDKYGEGAPNGRGPDQSRIMHRGNEYLEHDFPHLSYIESVTMDDNFALGEAAKAEESAGIRSRLGPLLVVLPFLLVALCLMGLIFHKVFKKFNEDDEEEAPSSSAPKPTRLGANALE